MGNPLRFGEIIGCLTLDLCSGLVLSSDAKVSDLIDVSIKGRNCVLIDKSFSAYVANIIKNIHLCPSLPPDKIIWNGTSNGMFSVKSAYHMALDLLRRKNGECSASYGNSIFWKKNLGS